MQLRTFEDGRSRPAVGLLTSAAGIVVIAAVAALAAISLPVSFPWLPDQLALLFWFSLLMLPLLLGFYWILTHFLERRPLGSVGFAFHPRWKNELATGLIAGTLMIVAVAGIECLLGFARFTLAPGPWGRTILGGVLLFLLLAVAAADEELIFRGYPFQRLVDLAGPVVAVVLASALFGAAHLRNPFQNWVSTLNTALVGGLLAVCYLRTRALWLPLGIHVAWNFVQAYVLGLPVSGVAFPHTLLQAKISGPFWLTGGAYGPEGSILSLGVIAAGTAYFFVSRRIYTTTEMWQPGPGRREVFPLFP